MESQEAEIMEAPVRDRRGRQRLGDERWAELLRELDESGLSQRAFAEREGISYPTLVSRLQRRRREQVGPAPGAGPQVRFAEVTAGLPMSSSAEPIEVRLPCGLVVRGTEVGALVAMVRALRS